MGMLSNASRGNHAAIRSACGSAWLRCASRTLGRCPRGGNGPPEGCGERVAAFAKATRCRFPRPGPAWGDYLVNAAFFPPGALPSEGIVRSFQ